MNITYNFKRKNNKDIRINVDLKRIYIPENYIDSILPEWTHLEHHQCKSCPLNINEHKYCPAALEIYDVSNYFDGIFSFENVLVTVDTPQRKYEKETDIQTGLNSLLGLILASSGCPILSKFRQMALTHLPFSSVEESIIRTTAFYLLRQHFMETSGEKADYDLQELEDFYSEISKVNYQLNQRVSALTKADANSNAINAFFSLSELVRMSLKEQLEEVKHIFL